MAMIGIVPEELKEENYEFWKVCLKSYLVGQGLWDVVSKEAGKEEQQSPEWQKKNAQALHAIQLACGSRVYSKYKKQTHVSAKFAWDHLAELHVSPSHLRESHDEDHSVDINGMQDYPRYEELYKAIEGGDIKLVKEILSRDADAKTAIISSHKDTALHIAILSGKEDIALELVECMPSEGLEIANQFGATPLSLAAMSEGTKLAQAMVKKNHKLVMIKKGEEDEGQLPVIVASMYGRKRMVHYLYSKTPKEVFDPSKPFGLDGTTLLNNLITADFFDLASMLLKSFPKLGITPDHLGHYPLRILAHKPSAFPSGTQFSFWKHWIYSCVSIHSPWDEKSLDEIHHDEAHIENDQSNTSDTVIDIDELREEELQNRPQKVSSFLHGFGWILLRCLIPA